MAKRHEGGYARTPWCQLDLSLADELIELTGWAYGGMRSNAARTCVSVALHLAPHIRPGKGGEPPAAKVTARALAEETGANASTVSRALRRLEAAGFVSATPDPTGGATSFTFSCHAPGAGSRKGSAPKAPAEEERKPWENPDGSFRELSGKELYALPDRDIYDYEQAQFRQRISGGVSGHRPDGGNPRGGVTGEGLG